MLNLLKDYAYKRAELVKLEVAEKGVLTLSTFLLIGLITVFFVFFLAILNIGIAILVGEAIDNYAMGFLIVAGFYLLLFILLIASLNRVKSMIANMLLNTFNNEEDED